MTLKGNVNPWIDMNVIEETILKLCGHEDQSKGVEEYIEKIKNTLLSKDFFMTFKKLFQLRKQVSSNILHMFLFTVLVNPKELTYKNRLRKWLIEFPTIEL